MIPFFNIEGTEVINLNHVVKFEAYNEDEDSLLKIIYVTGEEQIVYFLDRPERDMIFRKMKECICE